MRWPWLVAAFSRFVASRLLRPPFSRPRKRQRGRTAYLSSCVKCHTDTLVGRDGTGKIPEFLKPYEGLIPPLAGANPAYPPFLTKWGPQTTKDLFRRIQEAVGGFPPEGRNAETYLNLTAYVLEVNGAKPGTQALTAATAVGIDSITKQ